MYETEVIKLATYDMRILAYDSKNALCICLNWKLKPASIKVAISFIRSCMCKYKQLKIYFLLHYSTRDLHLLSWSYNFHKHLKVPNTKFPSPAVA